MNTNNWLMSFFKTTLALVILGVSMSSCGTNTFTWKEEVLLHDGKSIIVVRSDVYDASMGHEIGQGDPIAEHTITFKLPGKGQEVSWKSDNRPPSLDHLNLLILDIVDGVPYLAATPFGRHAYIKWNRPNPPYVFFKYDHRKWQRISLEEFPEKFKINLIVTGRKKDEPRISETSNKFGFVPAQMVSEINKEPGMSKEYYSLLRTPINYGPSRPDNNGSKAPEASN